MAYTESLKIFDKFHYHGIGENFTCFHVSFVLESHHLFFNYSFSLNLLKDILPYGDFFFLEPSFGDKASSPSKL